MGTHRRRRSKSVQQRLALEQLEIREMMAVDLTAAAAMESLSVVAGSRTAPAARSPFPQRETTTSIPTPNAAALSSPRTMDGTENNPVNSLLGSAGQQLIRAAEAQYADGVSSPAGADRPSPREISNVLAAQDEATALNDRQLTAFIYVWGQFLDHDIDLTSANSAEYLGIEVPTGDAEFDPLGTGTQEIAFSRSVYDPSTGTSVSNPRQQISEITVWIDGSMVYGSDAATAASLRTLQEGQLKTSAGDLPPTDAAGNFLAGDVRANENIELTSMQTLFLREHNYWAAKIARENPQLGDEQIYQRARAIVIAEIQAITYEEFLPALLGQDALDGYSGYDPAVDPSIASEFSTAAFRLHTLINDDVEFFGNDGRAVRDEVELRDAFFNPGLFSEIGPDGILKYSASTLAQEADNQIVDGLRNFLFGEPGQGGLDLASLNIQRGRDHGLADYNTVRAAYGLAPVASFDQVSSDVELQHKLDDVYISIDDVDLWVGLLAEDHAAGASVGPTSQAIIADQFERLRDGDRYWYQNIFSGSQLSQLENTTLADVIKRNTTVTNLQGNVFFFLAEVNGQVFADLNANERQDRGERPVAGVAVELLNDEGAVLAATETDSRGRYRFTSFAETGDYQIRIVPPAGTATARAPVRNVLISRGGLTIGNVNFGLRATGASTSTDAVTEASPPASVDAAFADLADSGRRRRGRL